jgi:hypothetical protein
MVMLLFNLLLLNVRKVFAFEVRVCDLTVGMVVQNAVNKLAILFDHVMILDKLLNIVYLFFKVALHVLTTESFARFWTVNVIWNFTGVLLMFIVCNLM